MTTWTCDPAIKEDLADSYTLQCARASRLRDRFMIGLEFWNGKDKPLLTRDVAPGDKDNVSTFVGDVRAIAPALDAPLLVAGIAAIAIDAESRDPRLTKKRLADDEDDPRPWLNALNGDLQAAGAEAWQAIRASNDPPSLFRYGDQLARVDIGADGPMVRDLDALGLRYELAERTRPYKETEGGRTLVYPPPPLCQHMLAAPHYPVPRLTRIAEAPVFAQDGALQTEPGYHASTGVYYNPPPGLVLPPVSDDPTADEVTRARDLILTDLLQDFPFTSEAERANIVAALLQPFVRDLINGPTPLHLIEAPSPGSGKGLLADVITIPAVGRNVAVISPATGDDEWRKRITAQGREAPPVILIDNISRALDSGVLAAALTAISWKDRRLGHSETVTVPVRWLWLATANNPTMSTEIARRVVRTRLDALIDRPWQRPVEGFHHGNLRAWAHDHRSGLIWAACTLIRRWFAAGQPRGTTTLGSYERWAAVLGGILGTASIAGFLGNLDDLYEASDQEGALWRAFVAVWWEKHEGATVGTADLFPLALAMDGFDLGRGDERAQRTTFGKQLGRQRDRVIGEYRVVEAGKVKRAAQWRLDVVNVVNVGERFATPAAQKDGTAGGTSTVSTETDPETFTNVHNVHPDSDETSPTLNDGLTPCAGGCGKVTPHGWACKACRGAQA